MVFQNEVSSVSSGATGLAGRYAGAVYALAVEGKKIDAIHADLTALAGLVAEHWPGGTSNTMVLPLRKSRVG